MDISFTTNKKTLNELKQVLIYLNDSYKPILSSQTNIDSYVIKLNNKAEFVFINNFNRTIGLVAYYINNKESFITSIGIHKNYHGKQLGQLLFDKYLKILLIKKINKISLHVNRKNFKAQKFYLKNGFELEELNETNFLATRILDNKLNN